jgi:hypothetical protein
MKAALASVLGSAVVRMPNAQPPLQSPHTGRPIHHRVAVRPRGDLLRPARMTGPDDMQVRDPVLHGRVRLDEKPALRPLVQAGQRSTIRPQRAALQRGRPRREIGRSGHEVDDWPGR